MKDWDSLVDDVKEIKRDVKEIGLSTARNTTSLELHMARTEANEKRIHQVEQWLVGLLMAIFSACLYYFLRR